MRKLSLSENNFAKLKSYNIVTLAKLKKRISNSEIKTKKLKCK